MSNLFDILVVVSGFINWCIISFILDRVVYDVGVVFFMVWFKNKYWLFVIFINKLIKEKIY